MATRPAIRRQQILLTTSNQHDGQAFREVKLAFWIEAVQGP